MTTLQLSGKCLPWYIDSSSTMQDTSKSILDKKEKLKSFFDHCCQVRRYSFCAKNCGEPSCTICKPVKMDAEIFKQLRFLPDPVMGLYDHYVPFAEIYGKTFNEDHCPSLAKRNTNFFTN